MDKVFIKNLNISTLIGTYAHERQTKQVLILDLELAIDALKTAINDDIKHTVDYEKLATWIIAECESLKFQLLETLAEYLCQNIIKIFNVYWVKLMITKPNAIKETKEVGICITRRAKNNLQRL